MLYSRYLGISGYPLNLTNQVIEVFKSPKKKKKDTEKSCCCPTRAKKNGEKKEEKNFSVLLIGNEKYSKDVEDQGYYVKLQTPYVGYYVNLQSYKLEENMHPIKCAQETIYK